MALDHGSVADRSRCGGQGSDLRTRQTKGSPHAPEKLAPTPAQNLRGDIHFLAHAQEETGSFFVGKEV